MEVPARRYGLGRPDVEDAGRANFEDVLGLIPNLNWAGDTSLPRYFNCAGSANWNNTKAQPIGGFLIDEIDF